jgi:excisionase family DNA binding protein
VFLAVDEKSIDWELRLHSPEVATGTQPALLSPRDVAQRLLVSRTTVYRLAADGSLASLRVGGLLRFSEADVHDYLKRVRLPETDNTGTATVDRRPPMVPGRGAGHRGVSVTRHDERKELSCTHTIVPSSCSPTTTS